MLDPNDKPYPNDVDIAIRKARHLRECFKKAKMYESDFLALVSAVVTEQGALSENSNRARQAIREFVGVLADESNDSARKAIRAVADYRANQEVFPEKREDD